MYKKHLDQIFIKDKKSIFKLIKIFNISKNDYILEIGPGKASLTKYILKNSKYVYTIELDKNLSNNLKKHCKYNINILNRDIIKTKLKKFKNIKNIKIIGNLPYKKSSLIIIHSVLHIKNIKEIFFMLQKEMIKKTFSINKKKSNKLKITLEYFFIYEKNLTISSLSFSPKPKIDSKIIKLIPYKKFKINILNYQTFSFIIKKKLKKTKFIKNCIIYNENKNNISLNKKRSKKLSIYDFIYLANKIEKLTSYINYK